MENNRVKVFLSIAMYSTSSILSTFTNKYVLMDNVIDVILLIFLQHTACLIFLFICRNHLKKFNNKNSFQNCYFSFYDGLKHMWPLILSYNFTLLFGNICLKYTRISVYQLARSMTLPLNFLFSYFLFKQIKFNYLMIFSCIMVSIGFFIFSVDAVNTNYKSVLYGIISSIIQAIHLNLLKEKLIIYKDKMIILHYNLIYSSIFLFIYLSITKDIFVIFMLSYRTLFFVFLSCISAVCVTLSVFLCIYYTDNIVYNMLGNVKATAQTFLSKFYYSENFNLNTIIGLILTTGGSFLYTCSSDYLSKKKIS